MSRAGSFGRLLRRVVLGLAALTLAFLVIPEAASAQSWWPFGGGGDEEERDDRPPMPQEPVYRDPQDVPPAPPAPRQPPPPMAPGVPNAPPPPGAGASSSPGGNWSQPRNPICLQLEQRLAQEGQKNGQSRAELPRVEDEIRQLERAVNSGESQLDRGCYDSFLFTKTLRNSRQCKDLARQVDASKRRLSDLDARRQEILGSSGHSYQDDIIRELARNNCGANYVAMARRRSDGMWEDEESSGGSTWSPHSLNGAQTYRTVCVRLCDGYYFPMSFSTLPNHFQQDSDSCSSKCAAPAELYYYPNPGGSMDQAVALKTQEAYKKLKFAFRYRKEVVNGCSCKAAEYVPADGNADKKAENTPATAPAQANDAATAAARALASQASAPPPPQPSNNDGWQTQAQP
ncbi:MAG TPA: DUF2865 domain-containing protein [Hyphomicrobium sp.]|nr:DUF2865 domain-containing protein [Hyphomicrobium sp.]